MLWDSRHALFPTLAPVLDTAISKAKDVISSLGGSTLPAKLKDALVTDHTAFTDKLKTAASNFLSSSQTPLMNQSS